MRRADSRAGRNVAMKRADVLRCEFPPLKAKAQKPREALRRPNPAAPLTYREWLAKAGAPVLASAHMRPKDWRDLYISGATPEQAAEYADRNRYNAKDAPTLRAKRR